MTLADDYCRIVALPGGLVQQGLHPIDLISTKVDNGQMNPAVLLDAHFSDPKTQYKCASLSIRTTFGLTTLEKKSNLICSGDKDPLRSVNVRRIMS